MQCEVEKHLTEVEVPPPPPGIGLHGLEHCLNGGQGKGWSKEGLIDQGARAIINQTNVAICLVDWENMGEVSDVPFVHILLAVNGVQLSLHGLPCVLITRSSTPFEVNRQSP